MNRVSEMHEQNEEEKGYLGVVEEKNLVQGKWWGGG